MRQLATLNVVRLIQLWRRNLWRPHPFVFQKDGSVDCNYMLKMGSDLGVLRMDVYMDVLRGVPLHEKDLVCVLFPDPKHAPRRPSSSSATARAGTVPSSAAARQARHAPTAGGGAPRGGGRAMSDKMTRMLFDHLLATSSPPLGTAVPAPAPPTATVGFAALQSMDVVRELLDGGRLTQRVLLDMYREAGGGDAGGSAGTGGDGGLAFAGFERFLDLITPLSDADMEPSYAPSTDSPPLGHQPDADGNSGDGNREPEMEYADGFEGDNPLREVFFLDRDLEELKTAAKVVAEEAKLQQALRTEQRALLEKKVFIPLLRTTKKKAK